MIKTLKTLFKQDKERFVVPKGVQDALPIKTVWKDGIFLVGKNKYAKTFKFEDINYAGASREDKEAMFLEYSELLNALDSGATTKITINNRRLNKADFEQGILPVLVPNAQNWMHQISFASSMTFSVLVRKQPFVPFVNKFPRNTELYKLRTTKFNEK